MKPTMKGNTTMFATLIVAFLLGTFTGLVIYAYTTDNKWNTADK